MKLVDSRLLAVVFMLVWLPIQSLAITPAEQAQLDARFKALTHELRCLVCQNETLADSSAELAEDFRQEIRVMLKNGSTDQEIIDFLVNRYGDFVLYRPPLKTTTWFLWFGPAILIGTGLVGLVIALRRRRGRVVDAPLSEDEQHHLEALVEKVQERRES